MTNTKTTILVQDAAMTAEAKKIQKDLKTAINAEKARYEARNSINIEKIAELIQAENIADFNQRVLANNFSYLAERYADKVVKIIANQYIGKRLGKETIKAFSNAIEAEMPFKASVYVHLDAYHMSVDICPLTEEGYSLFFCGQTPSLSYWGSASASNTLLTKSILTAQPSYDHIRYCADPKKARSAIIKAVAAAKKAEKVLEEALTKVNEETKIYGSARFGVYHSSIDYSKVIR